jgi:hypothetical protein
MSDVCDELVQYFFQWLYYQSRIVVSFWCVSSGPHFSHDMLSLADILYFSFHSWSKLVWYYFISGDPHGVNLRADLLLL